MLTSRYHLAIQETSFVQNQRNTRRSSAVKIRNSPRQAEQCSRFVAALWVESAKSKYQKGLSMISFGSRLPHQSIQPTFHASVKPKPHFGNIANDIVEVTGQAFSAYGNVVQTLWNNDQQGAMNWVGKGVSVITGALGPLIIGTPIYGSYVYLRNRKEANVFKKEAEALRNHHPEQFTAKIDEAFGHRNFRIRAYGIQNIASLPTSENEKFKRFITVLEDPDHDLFDYAKRCLEAYLQRNPHDQMQALLQLAPTLKTRTTYIPQTTTVNGIQSTTMVPITQVERTPYTPQYLELRARILRELND